MHEMSAVEEDRVRRSGGRARRSELGSALLVVMGAAAVLFVIAAAVIGVVVFQQSQLVQAQAVARASTFAQRGMEAYLTQLRTDPEYWKKHPALTDSKELDTRTWSVVATKTAGSTETASVLQLTAVGRDIPSGIKHVIVAKLDIDDSLNYAIATPGDLTLDQGANRTLKVEGKVRSDGGITLNNGDFRLLTAESLTGMFDGTQQPGNKVRVLTPLAQPRDFGNLRTAALKPSQKWIAGDGRDRSSLEFFRVAGDPGQTRWGWYTPTPTEQQGAGGLEASTDASGLVGVGIDLSTINPTTGGFDARSVWTPAGASSDLSRQGFVDFARTDPVWSTTMNFVRPLSHTSYRLSDSGDSVMYVGGNLNVYVKGEYARSVTIVSEKNIYIIGSITQKKGTSAMLGLVAKGDIYICGSMPDGEQSATYLADDGTTKAYTRGSRADLAAVGERFATDNALIIEARLLADGQIIVDPQIPGEMSAGFRATRNDLTVTGSLAALGGLTGPNFVNGNDTAGGGFTNVTIQATDTPAPFFPPIATGTLAVTSWDEFTTKDDPNEAGAWDFVLDVSDPNYTIGRDPRIDPIQGQGSETPPETLSNVQDIYSGTAVITLSVASDPYSDESQSIWHYFYTLDGSDVTTLSALGEIVLDPAPANTVVHHVITYWSVNMANVKGPEVTREFDMRGRDVVPAITTVLDAYNKAQALPDGYGATTDSSPYEIWGPFHPVFSATDPVFTYRDAMTGAVDTTTGLGVSRIMVRLGGTQIWGGMESSVITTDQLTAAAPGYAEPPVLREYQYYAIDNAGNAEESSVTPGAPLRLTVMQHALDEDAPSTIPDLIMNPLTGTALYVGKATIELGADDGWDGQGVGQIWYVLDGGPKVTVSNTTTSHAFVATLTVNPPTSGDPVTHTLFYGAVDRATDEFQKADPNSETTRSATFDVAPPLENDKTLPMTTSDARASYIGPATVNFIASDPAGIDKIYYQLGSSLGTDTVKSGSQAKIDAPWSGSREYTLLFWSTDLASPQNTESPVNRVTFTVYPEQTPPITSSSNMDLYAGPANITLSALDNEGGSGLAFTYYSIDGASAVQGVPDPLGNTQLTVLGDGAHVLTFSSVDNAGNREATKTATFRIDTTPPVTKNNAVATVYQGAAVVTLEATDGVEATGTKPADAGSGVLQTRWRVGASGIEQSANPVLLGPGTWEVQYWSVDKAGNAESPKSFTVTVVTAPDNSAPASYDDVVPYYKAGSNPPATVNLYSWDVQSGVATMNYIKDGGAQESMAGKGNPPQSYQVFFGKSDGSEDGTHTLQYWAVDVAGNIESPRITRTFKVDTILPVTACSARQGATYWTSNDFTLTPTDAGSGIKSTYWSLNGSAPVMSKSVRVPAPTNGFEKSNTIRFWSIDNAGNVEAAKTVTFLSKPSDTIAPTTYSNALSAYRGVAVISLTARDNFGGSGVAWTKYRLDNGTETTGTVVNGVVAIPVIGAGPHTLEFWSADNAGNIETPHKSVTYIVDALAPETLSDVKPLYNAPAVIHLTATDASDGSSIADTFWILDGGSVQTGTPPVTTINVSAVGAHTLKFWSVDGAGNVEATRTATFKIDMTAPHTTSDAGTEYYGTADIALSAVDETGGSGVAYTYYRIDGGTRMTGTAVSVPGPASGGAVVHGVTFWSVDAAGNVEDQHTVSFTVAPMADMTFYGMSPAENSTIIVRNPTVSVTGHANVSTVASATARIDGIKKPITLTFGGGYWVYQSYYQPGYYQDAWYSDPYCEECGECEPDMPGGWVEGYTVDNSYYVDVDYSAGTVSFPVTGLANGDHWVAVTFFDAAGATKTKTWKFTVNAPADVTAPLTTSDAVALYSAPATIALTAVDETGGIGVANTYWKLDGGAQQTGTPPRTMVNVASQGSHTLEFWSVDNSGNKETTRSVSFIVDMTPPVTTAGTTASIAGTATVWLSARDNAGGSGVKATSYRLDNGAVVSAGSGFSATGGTQYTSGGNTIIVFNASGSLVCNGSMPGASVLVVGGGGGGCSSGGGAGGYLLGTQTLSGTMAITVGSGGTGNEPSTAAAANGANSVFGTLTAIGGGGGVTTWASGKAGGSGSGGGASSGNTTTGGAGTTGQGNAGGGNAGLTAPPYASGGGGGAGTVGQTAPSATQSGAGGPGLASSISGTAANYAGGGGGGLYQPGGVAGSASFGGGAGGSSVANGTAGTANTGGGGGGAGTGRVGGAGGSGIVIISFPTPTAAPVASPGTVGQWHFEEGSGSTAADVSGNGSTGTLAIGPAGAQTTANHAWVNGSTGKFGRSLKFDGVDDYVNIGSRASLDTLESFSVGAWVKTSVNTGTQVIVGRSNAWRLVKYGNAYTFEHRNNESNNLVLAQGVNTSTDWVYVVGTFDSSTKLAKLYINGVLADTKTQIGTTCKSWNQNMIGGNYGWHPDGSFYNDYWWNGQIDEVVINNVARGPEDIQSYYTASAGGDAPPIPVTVLAPASGAPVSHTLAYWSIDNAGNVETIKNSTFSVSVQTDTTPPTTTSNAVTSYLRPQNITLTATDNPGGWGVAYTRYQLDTTSGVWATGTAAPTGGAGTHKLFFYSVDAAGNAEAVKDTGFYTVAADTAPPITTHNAVATYVGPNTITLTATDGTGWGVDKTFFRIDGGLTQTGTSIVVTAPVNLTPVVHTMDYCSIDLAGNKEATKTVSYSVTGVPAPMTFSGINPLENSIIKIVNPTVTITGVSAENILGVTATLDGAGQTCTLAYGGGYWVDNGYWSYEWVDDGCNTWQEWVWIPSTSWIPVDQRTAAVSFPTTALSSGSHTVVVTFNLASGAQGRKTWSFNVDLIAPTTTSNAQGSYTGTATITLTASDNQGGSGVQWTKYRVDAGADMTGTTIVVPPPQYGSATRTIYFWSADNVNNVESPKSATFVQSAQPDTTPPTTTSNALASYTAPGIITLTASDNVGGWGVANTYYQVISNGVAGAVTTGTAPVTNVPTGGPGNFRIEFWSVDRAGNIESPRKFSVYSVAADTTPPTTTSNAAASYNGTATITLTAVDNVGGWGIKNTFYRLDDGPERSGVSIVVNPPIAFSQAHHIDFYSVDKADNVEAMKTATFTITAIPPTMTWSEWVPDRFSYNKGTAPTISVLGQAPETIVSATATLTLPTGVSVPKAVVLAFPGVTSGSTQTWVPGYDVPAEVVWWTCCDEAEYYDCYDLVGGYSVPGYWRTDTITLNDATKARGTITTGGLSDGVYTVTYAYTMASGAIATHSWTFYVDNVAPVTTSNAVANYNTSAPIVLAATDAVSGVVASYYQIDNGAVMQGSSFTVPGPAFGVQTRHIDFYSIDRAGNVEAAKTATFTVTAPPDTRAPITTDNVQRWYRSIQTITLTPYDADWGVAYTKYLLTKNGVPGVLTTYTAAFPTGDGEGNYTLQYYSVDRAGNQETTVTRIFGVDMTAPVTTSNTVPNYQVVANITLSPTDTWSGVAATYYTVDDGTLRSGTYITVAGPTAGTVAHHIDFYSTDVAGNTETAKRADFTISANPAQIVWSEWAPPKLSLMAVRGPLVSVRGKALYNVTGATATIDGNAASVTLSYPVVSTVTTTTWSLTATYVQVGYWYDDGCDSYWVDQGSYYVPGWVTTTTTTTDYTDCIARFSTANLVDGVHTVSFTYTVAGGGQATESWTFTVAGPDNTPPTTYSNAVSSYVGTATITLTATDNVGGSGVKATYWQLDGGAITTGTVIVVAPPVSGAPVAHSIRFWSVDNANNIEVAKTANFTVGPRPDTTAPNTASNALSAYTGTAYISLVASDNVGGWGLKGTYYRLDSAAQVTYTGGNIVVPSPTAFSAPHTLEFWSDDLANNVETPHKFANFTISAPPDSTPPVTGHNAVSVYGAPSTITLTPVDNVGGWGVDYTKYLITTNGVPGVLTTGTSIPTGAQGSYKIDFWSRDRAGNQEATKTITYVVDTTAPVTSSNVTPVYNVTANISLVATDNHLGRSGVQTTWYKVDGGAWIVGTSFSVPGPTSGAAASHTIQFYSRDVAQNTETPVKSATFDITGPADTVAPTTTSNRVPFYAGPSIITLYPVDNVGGWGVATTYYKVDGGVAATGTSVPTGGTGAHNVEYWSVDKANNTETPHKTETYTVDTVKPTTTSNALSSYNGTATITLTAQDDPIGSGVKFTYYKVDNGTQQTGTTIVVAPPLFGSANHTITFWSVDNMNNTEVQNTASFVSNALSDTWAPVTVAGYQATYSKPGTITLTATDIGWGVKTINYILDGGAPVVGLSIGSGGTMSASCQLSTSSISGTHTLEFWSADQAFPTNTEAPHKTITYYLTPDTTPPVTTSNALSFYTGPAPIVLTATDSGWGVQYTHYIVDGGAETSGTSFTVPESVAGSVSHTIQFYSVDWAGNRETTKTATFTVKATPAVMTFTNILPPDGSVVTISNPKIQVAAASNQNIVGATMLLNGAPVTPTVTLGGFCATATLNATGLANGIQNVEVIFTAANGRQNSKAWTFTVSVQTDFIPPVTLSSAVSSYFGTATVALVATDNAGGSGVAYTKYKVDSGAVTTGTLITIGGPVSGAAVSHTIYWFSVDNAGNVEATKSATFGISPKDVTAPTTTSNALTMYKAPDTIMLQASDDQYGTGVAHTYYILDGGAQTEGNMVATGGQGSHELEFWSVDFAGNIETPHKKVNYKVDSTAPTTTSDAKTNYTGTATITLVANDNVGGSGVKQTFYIVDSGMAVSGKVITVAPPTANSAAHTIYFWSVDNAGNIEATKTATFAVVAPEDKTAPTTTSDAKTVYPVPSLITLTAIDNIGGWDVDHTYYKLDGGAQTEGLLIRTGGPGMTHTLEFWSIDKSGNEEVHKTVSYTVTANDTTPPLTTSNAQASYVGSATISLTATDNCGILPTTFYKVDSGVVTTGTTVRVPGPRSGTAAHTLYFWSVDLNGNIEATKTAAFSVQMKPADMVTSNVYPAAGSTVLVRNPVVTITAAGSRPVSEVIFELDGAVQIPVTVINGNQASMSYAASALTNGTHTAVAQFIDIDGGSYTYTWTFTVTAPADGIAPVTTSDGAVIRNGTAITKLYAADEVGGSGVNFTYYRIDNGPQTPGTVPTTTVSVSVAGQHTIEYWSVDRAGNIEGRKTLSFNIDVTPPTTSSNALGAYSGNAIITLTAADNVGGWGVANTYFKVDSGAVTSGTVATIIAPSSGAAVWHTLYFWSTDLNGNVEATKSVDFAVYPDTTVPHTTSDAAASYSAPGVIRLTATDGQSGSGVAHTYCRLDGGTQTESTILGTGGAGSHSVVFWSVDVNGNTEVPHTATYTVAGDDMVKPNTASNALSSYADTALISLTASDNAGGSGLKATYYRLDGGAQTEGTIIGVSTPGAHTLLYWSVDWAGNVEVAKTVTFTIVVTDVTPPVTTITALPSYVGTATISLSAADAGGSGVRTTFYRLDGGSSQQGLSVVVAPPASGAPVAHTIGYWSVDNAGNAEGERTISFTVAPPADTIAPTTGHNGVATYVGQATITLTPNDNAGGSGIKATYYRIDGGTQQTGTSIVVPAPASGNAVAHTIQFWSVDNANNSEVAKSFSFTVGPIVVSGNATLSFRWNGSGYADLHVQTAGGAYIAGTSVSGSGSDLTWNVTVPAGQSYRMVCDYYWDDDYESQGGGYGMDTGVVSGGQTFIWDY